MAQKQLCTRCFKAPEGDRTTFDYAMGNPVTDKFDPYCSPEHMHLEEEPLTELARLAVELMRADLMFHMFLSIGREDDLGPDSIIQRRRVMIADRIQQLEKLDEVKEILL